MGNIIYLYIVLAILGTIGFIIVMNAEVEK
jgi:hypothetical protein